MPARPPQPPMTLGQWLLALLLVLLVVVFLLWSNRQSHSADLRVPNAPLSLHDANGTPYPRPRTTPRPGCRYHGFKSAITGQWVSQSEAEANPNTTYHVCVR